MPTPDPTDTIVAIATARGPAVRGAIRLSGPATWSVLSRLGLRADAAERPTRFARRSVRAELAGSAREIPADVLVWPNQRSYTRQPSAEIHTVGAPPVLDAIVRACTDAGARLAEPGEFTLRAFLAGRIDLTQAEGVLSVIDADDQAELRGALTRLAGGLSTPLDRLRADLLGLLADLEAGLDFVEEEDVRFIEPDELRRRLGDALALVGDTIEQLDLRGTAQRLPVAVIAGPPNVGKSSLFNALVERFAIGARPTALVADQPGVTRDAVSAVVRLGGQSVELLDTAGDDHQPSIDAIDSAARAGLADTLAKADVVLRCYAAGAAPPAAGLGGATLTVATKSDLAPPSAAQRAIATSAPSGAGLDDLAAAVERALSGGGRKVTVLGIASDRARSGLETARDALRRALATAHAGAGEELVAMELREALDGLGRVVGKVVTDEVLGEVFGRFCIGK
ncbi:GTPase [Botrimarina sp.]|uniref:tRNA modification GTPase n=1 Tax=Botrimarina sp. TaxID=2795802 RepID=UPI0032F083D8